MHDKHVRFLVLAGLFVGALSADWNNLRVHFGVPFLKTSFAAMPRTEKDAVAAGMKLDTSCSVSNGFLGRRYVSSDGDRSIMLLFDNQGSIAGIQTAIPKSTGVPTPAMKYFHNVYLESKDEHVLTAYFVDPAIICNKGRPNSAVRTQGTGDRLVMQVGRTTSLDTAEVMEIPRNESETSNAKWTKGKCFIMMGHHYWYNMRTEMDCSDFFPAFTLYKKGKLNGFGFVIVANYEGRYYEHPTVNIAKNFFPFIPTCMHQTGFPATFTTVHIYLYNRPWFTQCWI